MDRLKFEITYEISLILWKLLGRWICRNVCHFWVELNIFSYNFSPQCTIISFHDKRPSLLSFIKFMVFYLQICLEWTFLSVAIDDFILIDGDMGTLWPYATKCLGHWWTSSHRKPRLCLLIHTCMCCPSQCKSTKAIKAQTLVHPLYACASHVQTRDLHLSISNLNDGVQKYFGSRQLHALHIAGLISLT